MNKVKDIVVDIVDDHKMVIMGLVEMINDFEGVRIGHTYHDGTSLLEGLAQQQPDILLMDVQMPDVRGDELAALVAKAYPEVRMIAITGFNTSEYARLMLEKGVLGYVLKNTDEFKLKEAIEQVHKGEQFIDPVMQGKILNDLYRNEKTKSGRQQPMLTRREKEILHMIIEEMTGQQMAESLDLSLRTIENHRVSLMQKLQAKNTAGIVKRAFQLGLVSGKD